MPELVNYQDSPPVWYLAHPVAPDDKYSYEQNMEHVIKILRVCYEAGFRVIVPWHTICLGLPDSVPEYRKIGLEVDCKVAAMLKRIIMVGHKVSSGMSCERDAVYDTGQGIILDLTELSSEDVKSELLEWAASSFHREIR